MRRRALLLGVTAAAVAISLAGCSEPTATEDCRSDVRVGALPEWAMTGFSDGAQVPRAVGHAGRIVAVPFSQPLVASQDPAPQNKVLLVPREPLTGPTPLRIEARLSGTGDVVFRERPEGPGPGTLDLPQPGCWRLTLTWGDQTDTLDLDYVAPPPGNS